MERNVHVNEAQGQPDSAAMRAALKEELIARELMVQEAVKRGLDKRAETEDALLVLRQNLLIDVLVQDELSKKPITEEEIKAEYDRQVKVISAGELQQYQLSAIVLENEADARAVVAALRSGQSFESLVKAKSIDPNREHGGELGWLLPDQMTPAIANVVVNLAAGVYSAAPIQVGPYWDVVKVLGKRAYQVPSLQDSKNMVQAAVVQQRRTALLKKLQDAAKITR
jgi:peptidyl-prolyl cis-trans isomerase C